MLSQWNEREREPKAMLKGKRQEAWQGNSILRVMRLSLLQEGGTYARTYAYNRTKHSNPEMEGILPKETSTYIILIILDLLVHIWL